MQAITIFSFIADDKPGIVEKFSKIIESHQGSWLESRLTQLAGKFTGIIEVRTELNQQQALQQALSALNSDELSIMLSTAQQSTAQNHECLWQLDILGLDRPGIVQEFSKALAQKLVNIAKMRSWVESAAMSGEPLFKAQAIIEAPDNLSLDDLNEVLEKICQRLDLEHSLKPHTDSKEHTAL